MSRTMLIRTGAILVAFLIAVGGAAPAGAHPLGSATINHAVAIMFDTDGVTIDLVVDMAEIPAAQRIGEIDTDGDLELQASELATFALDDCTARLELLDVLIDGVPTSGSIVAQTLDPEPGNAGLTTLRLECRFVYPHSAQANTEHRVEVVNRADQGRSGWREMTAVATSVAIRTALPSTSPTDQLRSYPDDDPTGPNLTSAYISYGTLNGLAADTPQRVARADAGSGIGDGEVAAPSSGRDSFDPLTGLLAQADDGMTALMVSLLVAAGIGAAHGLAPGHGKTVIAAYLVGTQGSRRQAVGLAAAVAASHTVGVFVLGAVTLLASNRFAPDAIYPALRLVSAVIILGIGVTLLVRFVLDRASASHTHDGPTATDAGHAHGDHHHDSHVHDHDHGDHHHDSHGHGDHGHGDHAHDGGFHVHGVIPHRHRTDWSSIDTSGHLGWRTLAGLGLAGGIVPSTSAVLVLLGAVQIGRLDLGAALVMAFGVGMSVALVSVGLGLVTMARAGGRRFDLSALSARWQRVLTPAAAAVITGVGVYLTVMSFTGLT